MELIIKELKEIKLLLMSESLKLKTPIIEYFQVMIKSIEVCYQSQKEMKMFKGLKVECTSILPHTP